MYKATEEQKYLCLARDVFDFYVEHGMTLTYENFNWFGKEDSWTEPCAIVDSFILSAQMFEITGNEKYQTLASRIWFNGLTFCHRANGGAGPNSCVTLKQPYLTVSMYEAPFCCSMRYCEGLKFAKKYEDIITTDEKIVKDKYGRVFKGNKILVIDEDNRFPQVRHIKFEDIDYIEIPSFSENGDYKLKVI